MIRRTRWLLVLGVGFAWGCGPQIKTITPTGKRPLESVLIEGQGNNGALQSHDHAVIYVDGGPVGSPQETYPKPEIFIPVGRPNGTHTTDAVDIYAMDSAGQGNTVRYKASAVPVNAPPVSVETVSPPAASQFNNELAVTITGHGIFPGTRHASRSQPHAGPSVVQAIPLAGGSPTNAKRVVMLTDTSLQAFFPSTLPRGVYQIYIKNEDRYGGMSGASSSTFEWK